MYLLAFSPCGRPVSGGTEGRNARLPSKCSPFLIRRSSITAPEAPGGWSLYGWLPAENPGKPTQQWHTRVPYPTMIHLTFGVKWLVVLLSGFNRNRQLGAVGLAGLVLKRPVLKFSLLRDFRNDRYRHRFIFEQFVLLTIRGDVSLNSGIQLLQLSPKTLLTEHLRKFVWKQSWHRLNHSPELAYKIRLKLTNKTVLRNIHARPVSLATYSQWLWLCTILMGIYEF